MRGPTFRKHPSAAVLAQQNLHINNKIATAVITDGGNFLNLLAVILAVLISSTT